MNRRNRYRIKSAYSKVKDVARGTLEGVVGTMAISTFYRKDKENFKERNDYRNLGFFIGSMGNILGHVALASRYDYHPSFFAPLVAANILSLGYEKVRKYIKK